MSFSSIVVREGFAPMSQKWGCFLDEVSYPPDIYEHSVSNGAVRCINVVEGNRIGDYDCVGVQLGVPPVSDGGFTLHIPLTWGLDGGPFNHAICTMSQVVSVSSNGVTMISKGGFSTTRGVQ